MNPPGLTLAAEDSEDLEILSARLQDAVARLGDLVYLPRKRRFVALFNRFKWEAADGSRNLRVRAGLHIDGVLSAQSKKLKRGAPGAVVVLLALTFTPKGGEDPGGAIEFLFADGASIRLEVECIDAVLSDMEGEWAALGRPVHDGEET